MANLQQVIEQMQAHGLPPLPPGSPLFDGKIHRFGPKKKAWYALREVPLRKGGVVIGGAFGWFQGAEKFVYRVEIDWQSISPEERAAAEQRQREIEEAEREKRQRAAENAANRARMQWAAGSPDGLSPYLDRKQISPEGVRFQEDGTLLVPMVRYSHSGRRLVGLQKIGPDGAKRFNKGMEKSGAALRLGAITDDEPVIGVAEGYATARSIRLACEERAPVVVAFDAGNLLHVARMLRAAYPRSHLVFFADDDYQLVPRFVHRLAEQFNVTEVIEIDGVTRTYKSGKGEDVEITAAWKQDPRGVENIDVDIRSGRLVLPLKFENAGIAYAKAAAAEVGNASVVWPRFANRGDNKWTDFNDLHVQESFEVVVEQVCTALEGARAFVPVDDAPDAHSDLPPPSPPDEWAESKVAAVARPTLDVLLEHFALVYGRSEVWDGLNRQLIKKSAFFDAVGKELGRQWWDHEKRRNVDPRSLPVLRRGRAVEGGGGDRLAELCDKLVLLYGTETVWDGSKRMVLSIGAVRAAYGSDLVSRWQEDPRRKMIDAENLVFDPTMRVNPETHINMFGGYPLVPKEDDDKTLAVLELLFDLCRGEENWVEVGHWLLKWLAYPLQHPGAKMQTAVLMFGEKQGTGKSLFFEGIVRPIYGEYGGTAGQHQLDSSFTAWKSRKTFMVFEEVLSREDRYSHIGTLKHMITGRDMRINPKNLPERVEANHLNSTFLSNEPQPIPLELEDRRFLVIEARNKITEERVNQLRKLMDEGVSAAFYHYLLHYPLGDFNPHTKPIMTEAKRRIIRYGRSGWDAFHETWKEGDLPAPYISCISEDLYEVYKRWCERTRERTLTLTKFSELLGSRETKQRKWITLGLKKVQRTVFIIKAPDGTDSDLSKNCQKFRDAAGIKEIA